MRHLLTATLIFSVFFCSCKRVDTNPAPDEVDQCFQNLLQEVIRGSFEQVPGVSMTVMAPDIDLYWSGATGFDSKEEEDSLSVNQPFRIASVTKTFVATAILRLHEMDSLDINDPISLYISPAHEQLLEDNGYSADSIRIRHCLNHTSGLYDYAMQGQSFAEYIIKNPQKRWSRTEQIQLAMDTGKRTGSPGERYSYGDTGYILAGEIIENLLDTTLGAGLRQLLQYDQLDMPTTWLEIIEETPDDILPYVHRYLSRFETTIWDASMDLYGGGGLVSNTPDLANFMHALFNGGIYEKEETLQLMLKAPVYADTYLPEEDERFKDYRQGLWEINIFGEKVYMHGGLWGTGLFHLPKYNCTIAVNNTAGRWDRLIKQVVLVVKHLNE